MMEMPPAKTKPKAAPGKQAPGKTRRSGADAEKDAAREAQFQTRTKRAKPSTKKADLEQVQSIVDELLAEARANPGNGRVLWHLTNIDSELQSLHQAAETEAMMVRPEGE